jgi:hypothetical protein
VEATSQVQHIEVEEEYSDYSDQGEGDESSSDFGQPFEGEEVGSHGEPKKKRKRKRKKKKPVEAVGMQSQHVGVVEQPMAPAGQGFIKTNSREGMSYTGEVEAESVQRTEPVFTPEPVYAAEPVYAPEPPYRAEPVYNAEPVYQPEVRYQEPAPRVLDTRSGGEPELDVVQGLLLGWFVIYDQSGKGVAREIHSGRFFVGGAQLRDSDFVLVHPSVSTPHCLVNCIPGDGVKVLDLMSERGTYVKRRGTNAYVRHAEQVTLAHGDWVRFGSFEVLVCLIPA